MSVEELIDQQRSEIAHLTGQVDQLQQLLRSTTAEADRLRKSMVEADRLRSTTVKADQHRCPAVSSSESEQLQTIKAELDHERQKAKAIWAAVLHVAGEATAHRIEEEVSRRPIVAAPKVRRRGTMPHMPAPHITVVTKTATDPKWPPSVQEEPAAPKVPVAKIATAPKWPPAAQDEPAAPEEPLNSVQMQADHPEGPKSEFEVDSYSVPPSVARRLFDLGFKGKDQKDPETLPSSLPVKLDGSESARVAEVASPMRRRTSSEVSSGVPPLPRPHVSQTQNESAAALPGVKARSKGNARSSTPVGTLLKQRAPVETPPPPQVRPHSSSEDNTTPVSSHAGPMASSVRDRIRQLELSARRNTIQN